MLIGGLDVGTTGCKLTLYNEKGEFVSNEYREYNVTRQNGVHEIDSNKIIEAVYEVIKTTAKEHKDISAISITSFGESFAALDENDNPLVPMILYTDPRGKEETDSLISKLGADKISYISGLSPHSMFSLPKLMWIKNNKPDVYKKIKRVLLPEDFVIYMLTGKAYINYSLATRTMAFDVRNKCWSKEIFDAADIDITLMSTLVPSGTIAGNITKEKSELLGLSEDTKIVVGCHDQVAAALGSGILEVGNAVDGTGTVECITPLYDKIPENNAFYEGKYCVVPYVLEDTYVTYAFNYTGGAVLKWFRDTFAELEKDLAEKNNQNVYAILDENATKTPTNLLVLPHFAGAATPYMDTGSKASIIGLTLETTKYDIYRALMEGASYEMMLNLENLSNALIKPKMLYATGGGASSDTWLQIKADVYNLPIVSLDSKETGACGCCMLAAVAVGICKDLFEARKIFVKEKKSFTPNPENVKLYSKKFQAYKDVYNSVRPIVEKLNNN